MTVASFDPDGLWMKARLFINRAMDGDREFEESAFWACASLELLGKHALANRNVLLIANPDDDGKSLLIASGLNADTGFSSVQAKAIWSRCARAFKPFSEREAKSFAAARNEYLHAAGVGFAVLPHDVWWSRFWAQAAILVKYSQRSLEDLVGSPRIASVEKYLALNKEHQQRRLELLLESARLGLAHFRSGTMNTRQLREWQSFRGEWLTYNEGAMCPACEANGTLSGEDIWDKLVDYDVEGVSLTLYVGSEVFSCDTCHLIIDDPDLISEAGLEESFSAVGDPSLLDEEDDYMNE